MGWEEKGAGGMGATAGLTRDGAWRGCCCNERGKSATIQLLVIFGYFWQKQHEKMRVDDIPWRRPHVFSHSNETPRRY
jgi:hypothetical protein